MDAVAVLEGELSRLEARQASMADGTVSRLDALSELLRGQCDADGDALMGGDGDGEGDAEDRGEALRKAVRGLQDAAAADMKDVVGCLSKFSRRVDAVHAGPLADVIAPSVALPEHALRRAVAEHLYHVAMFDVAKAFCDEARVSVPHDRVRPFETLHALLSAFRAGDLAPAMCWAHDNRGALTREPGEPRRAVLSPADAVRADAAMVDQVGLVPVTPDDLVVDAPHAGGSSTSESESSASSSASSRGGPREGAVGKAGVGKAVGAESAVRKPAKSRLEFSLARLEYLDMVQGGDRAAALRYAQSILVTFVADYLLEVQQLMACLMYAPRVASSPYKQLVDSSQRAVVERLLCAEYCRVSGLSLESPLLSVVRCGAIALPVLLKASRVSPNWRDLGVDDVMPVEINIGRECQFHSVFTCPVSREECLGNGNVPMILPCGHVLSRNSIHRLPRGSNPRFKCPYCPMEQLAHECRQVKF